jgi:hypothetical protein
MAYQNDSNRTESRNRSYLLPLVILTIAVVLGLMFLMPDNEADNLASTTPAAGSMDNDTTNGQAANP